MDLYFVHILLKTVNSRSHLLHLVHRLLPSICECISNLTDVTLNMALN
jgi:hypothetical protein